MKEITIFHYLIFIKLTTAYFLDSLFKKYIIKSFNVALLYEVCKNFLILATVCHIIGSFYFYIDVLMYESGWYGKSQLWIFSSYAFPNMYSLWWYHTFKSTRKFVHFLLLCLSYAHLFIRLFINFPGFIQSKKYDIKNKKV